MNAFANLTTGQYAFIVIWMGLGLLLYAYPVVKILRRMGFSGGYLLLAFIPGFAPLIGLWVLAFARWPALDTKVAVA